MSKHLTHQFWTKFRAIKPQYFLILTVITGLVCIFALRANDQHMGKLRAAVYVADRSDTNVEQALQNLQAYVTAHMNTNLSSGNTSVYPPIQLEYTYARLVQAQSSQLQAANGELYTEAQTYCQKLDPTDFSGHNRVPCIESYVTQHGEKPLPAISTSLYEFDFISPRWSPDLAGWTLLVTGILILLTLISYIADR